MGCFIDWDDAAIQKAAAQVVEGGCIVKWAAAPESVTATDDGCIINWAQIPDDVLAKVSSVRADDGCIVKWDSANGLASEADGCIVKWDAARASGAMTAQGGCIIDWDADTTASNIASLTKDAPLGCFVNWDGVAPADMAKLQQAADAKGFCLINW